MEGRFETQLSPDPSSIFSFSSVLKLEVGTANSSVAALHPFSGSTTLLGSIHHPPSSEFSLSFELEVGTDASTVATVPPSSEFLLSFAFEIEEGTYPSSAAAVPPSSVSTAFLGSFHSEPSSESSF